MKVPTRVAVVIQILIVQVVNYIVHLPLLRRLPFFGKRKTLRKTGAAAKN